MENRASKYLLYAIGEIVLVVIGILIALQINNWNEQRKERGREVEFLKGLKTDLLADRASLESVIENRTAKVKSCIALQGSIQLETYTQVFSADSMISTVLGWVEYVPQTNTFDELVNSGNLGIIKNDSIKNRLLKLKQDRERDHTYTLHMRREYDHYLYDRHAELGSVWPFGDFEESAKQGVLVYQVLSDDEVELIANGIKAYLSDRRVRNGLRLAAGNNSGLLWGCQKMYKDGNELIELIEEEINK
ncbi:DUF6090 family protein [Cryomorphaceae bacterium 1068]|nr:DUF6090 family protein [Cryomorphaceae bacterium 1068]